MQLERSDILPNHLAFLACVLCEDLTIDEAINRTLNGKVRTKKTYFKNKNCISRETTKVTAINLETGEKQKFESLRQAERELFISYSTIAGAIRKRNGMCKRHNLQFIINK
jgi:hypothetical protein